MSVIRKSLVFAVALLGIWVGTAHAQGMIIVKVPFSFLIGQNRFAAGQYEISRIEGVGNVISIQRMNDPSSSQFLLTNSAGGTDPAGDEPSLVFTRNANGYRLTRVWDSTTDGVELIDSSTVDEDTRAHAQGRLNEQLYVLPADRQ
jgi:hypothetical protein